MKKVLITGGMGFLGFHLAHFLLKKNCSVTLLDIEENDLRDLKGKVKFLNINIKNSRALEKAFKGMDYIVHAAAALPIVHSRKLIYATNVRGTKNVLEASLKNKIKKVVFISSTAVYGIPERVPETEGDKISPIGNYGESKVEGEKLCMKYFEKGLGVNIIRPKTFLGPERLGVFTLWFEAIYSNKPVFILGKGNNLYQLLEVKDLCDQIYNALLIKKSGEVFNAGAAKFGTWRKDLRALIKHAKSKSQIVSFPVLPSQLILQGLEAFNLSPIVAWHYKTFPINSFVSIEKARKHLNFKPKKGNVDILIESYDWYRKHRSELLNKKGNTHRTIWNFKLINVLTKFA